MLLYANGCSMTSGEELGGQELNTGGIARDIDPVYKEQHVWPTVLANSLGMDYYNHAVGGSSNDRIIRTTLEWTSDYLKNNSPEDLFVVIGWSSHNRIEFRIDNQWYNILNNWIPPIPHHKKILKFYNYYIYDEMFDSYRSLINMISLQSWFKTNKIPYLFCNTLEMRYPTNTESKPLLDMIDAQRYLKFPDETYNMYSIARNYRYPMGPRKHPLAEGHEHWANVLLKYINENDLLKV